MIDKRFWVTCLAVLAVAAGSAALAGQATPETTPLSETVSGVEQPADTSAAPDTQEYVYIIREYEGKVAVFTKENPVQPEMVLHTLVKFLPDYDRGQLQEGILVADYTQLLAIIEDFSS